MISSYQHEPELKCAFQMIQTLFFFFFAVTFHNVSIDAADANCFPSRTFNSSAPAAQTFPRDLKRSSHLYMEMELEDK